MRILIDTSIAVRLAQPGTSACSDALAALAQLDVRDFQGCIVPQVLYEYWVVCTRPTAQNGLGFSAAQTDADLKRLQHYFLLLRDERTVFENWHKLAVQHGVLGKNAHDTRLVAAMQRHQFSHVLTFNKPDFSRYPGIVAMTPAEVLSGVL